jgi:hypothetical protein
MSLVKDLVNITSPSLGDLLYLMHNPYGRYKHNSSTLESLLRQTQASFVHVTPTGNLTSTNGQSAYAELDTHLTTETNARIAEDTNLNAIKLNLSGGTMTGLLLLSGAPINPLGAVTKEYVDNLIDQLSGTPGGGGGGTGTGVSQSQLNSEVAAREAADIAEASARSTADSLLLALTGGTLTGPLLLHADPTTNLGAATKRYVDVSLANFTATIPDNVATQSYVTGLLASYALTSSLGSYLTTSSLSPYLTSSSAASTYAPLVSPSLTGTPTVPTATPGDNSAKIASTAFIHTALLAIDSPVPSALGNAGRILSTDGTNLVWIDAATSVGASGKISEPLTNGDPNNPELLFDQYGDVITGYTDIGPGANDVIVSYGELIISYD